jgi:hypothetical protein
MADKSFITKAFLAYFGRPADLTALTDFKNSSEAEIEAAFAASKESKDLNGDTFNANQINNIYESLFGRSAEQAGIDYWLAKVADNTYTKAGAAIAILNGALNDDAVKIQNKLLASTQFTGALGTDKSLYSGAADAEVARKFIESITLSPATQAEINKAVFDIGGSSSTSQIFTLSSDSTTVIEGQTATFTVTRTDATTTQSILFNTIGDTNGATVNAATAGVDTSPVAGIVVFAIGQATATFTVNATKDVISEGLEGLKVTLISGITVIASTTVLVTDEAANTLVAAAALATYNMAAETTAEAIASAVAAATAADVAAAAVTSLETANTSVTAANLAVSTAAKAKAASDVSVTAAAALTAATAATAATTDDAAATAATTTAAAAATTTAAEVNAAAAKLAVATPLPATFTEQAVATALTAYNTAAKATAEAIADAATAAIAATDAAAAVRSLETANASVTAANNAVSKANAAKVASDLSVSAANKLTLATEVTVATTDDASAAAAAAAAKTAAAKTANQVTSAELQLATATPLPANFAEQAFALTPGLDTIPGLIGSNATSSTAGDNIILAAIGSPNETTLNSSDNLNAGSGADVLNVRIASLTTKISVAPVLTSVETLSIANVDTSFISVVINLTSALDVKTVEYKNTSAQSNITVLNASASATIVLDNADGSSVGQNVNLGSNAGRTGSADAFAIKIANGSGSSSLAAGFNLVNNDRTDDTSFETANMTVAGTRSFIVVGEAMAGLTTVNVTGETTDTTPGFGLSLSQVTGFDNLKTVDASGMTGGGLGLDARGSTATGFTFTGSTAADTLFLSKASLDASGTLNGGSGKDILMTTSFNVATAVNRATGFEVLQASTPVSLDASSFTGINEFVFTGNSGSLNITGVESNDRFVLAGDIGGSPALRFIGKNAGSSVVFEMRANADTNGEVTIISNSNSGNDASAIDFQNSISSVTIDSTGTNSKANLIEAVRTGNYNFYAFDNNSGLSNFRITGSQNLTIEAKEGVDLSTNSRTFGFTNAANVDASIFTGVLRIAGSRSDDVIAGGNGNDIIYGLGGNDTLTGNGGSDQFRMVGSSGTDIIKDFATGMDKIGFNNLDFSNTTATSAGATLSTQDYVDNRASINAIGAGDDKKVIELQSALSTTQIQTDTGGTAAAYVLVFNSTKNKGELWFDTNWSDSNSRSQVATFDNITSLAELTGFKSTDFVEFIA